MTNFTKRLITIVCACVTLIGLITFAYCGKGFFKVESSQPIDFNTIDTEQMEEGTLVDGGIQYVVDTIASAHISGIGGGTFNYYLVPIQSQRYIIVATSDKATIGTFYDIYEETCQFLNDEIEDTSTSVTIEGELLSLDTDLKSMLYSWNNTTGYFSTTSIMDEVLPYVIYTQDFSAVEFGGIMAIVVTLVGVVGLVVSIKCIKVA